jgi:uncharacterized protein YciI
MEAHTAFLQKHYDSGRFILSGRRKPKSGSVILCNAASRREVEEIMSEDPLERFQLALYEIIEFEPTKYANTLGK